MSERKALPWIISAGGLAALALVVVACDRADRAGGPTRQAPTPTSKPAATASSEGEQQVPTMRADGPSIAPETGLGQGQLVRTNYAGLLTEGQVPLLIYLPPGYESSTELLATIYLLHGSTFDESQWVELGIIEYAETAIREGRWPSLALVMPYQSEPLFSSSDGGPGSYEEELIEALLPQVEKRFGLSALRGLVGISRGGVWALEIAFRHPDDFLAVAALSPSLNVNFARPRYDPFWLAAQGSQLPGRIFLGAGDREPAIRQSTEELAAVLAEAGVPHRLDIGSGGHDSGYWKSSARSALDFLVESLRTPTPQE